MHSMKTPLAGFRFSSADAIVLAVGGVGSWLLWDHEFPLWWIVPAAVVHFFLFCNVIRLRRSLELVWAAAFIVNVIFWLTRLSVIWLPPMLTQLPITLMLILSEILSPRYHGIFASRINARLPDYLAERMKSAN